MEFNGLKYLVVGAGFTGAVIAERLAAELGTKVVVIDKRRHAGGNCFSELDFETGIECHRYGTHIFHTRQQAVWDYLRRFTSFNHYRHRVYTKHNNRVYPMPINLETFNLFYGLSLDPAGMKRFLDERIARDRFSAPANLEEQAISLAGRELYEAFIKNYTAKQWETDPALLPPEIIQRLPFRYSYHADYFDDPFQGLPLIGYAQLFAKILRHGNITLCLDTDFFDIKERIPAGCKIIYTGAIDRYLDYRFGKLGWRSLRFERQTVEVEDFQGTSVLNFADPEPTWTRIHEFKHLHPERAYRAGKTVICREFACGARGPGSDPYYPIDTARDREILQLYRQAAAREKNVIFCGRLGAYKYLDMDQAIAAALQIAADLVKDGSC